VFLEMSTNSDEQMCWTRLLGDAACSLARRKCCYLVARRRKPADQRTGGARLEKRKKNEVWDFRGSRFGAFWRTNL
jgi:hypothetical protein